VYDYLPGHRWLSYHLEQHGDIQLLCVPQLINSLAEFGRWPRILGNIRISILHYPAERDTGWWHDRPTFQAQAADLIDDIGGSLPGRFAFFGHGDAALLSYEAALELARRKMPPPVRLIVSASPAPQDSWASSTMPSEDELTERALSTTVYLGSNPLPSIIAGNERALLAHATARMGYRVPASKRLECPVTAICWSDAEGAGLRTILGWRECADTTFVTLPGRELSYTGATPDLLAVIAGLALSKEGTR
jgi:surfactin synthase thioesterase subunit